MELDVRVVDISANVVLLCVSGKIKSGVADALERAFDKLCQGPPVHLILDVHAVDAIDSSGMAVLIKGRNEIIERGGAIALIGITDRVSMIIKISGLDNFFPIAASQAEAIQLMRQSTARPKESNSSPSDDAS